MLRSHRPNSLITAVCSLLCSLFFVFLGFSLELNAQTLVFDEDYVITDGPVNAIANDEANGVVYIGGNFRYVGPSKRGLASYLIDGEIDDNYPRVNVGVEIVIPDGYGGVIVASDNLEEVGGQERLTIARIDSLGQVMPLSVEVSGSIFSMCLKGDTLFVAGVLNLPQFAVSQRLIAIDIVSSAVLTLSELPTTLSAFSTISANSNTLFVGGSFTSAGGFPRNRLAAFDANTGALLPWAPTPNGTVHVIAATDSVVYVGGSFSAVEGDPRAFLAAVPVDDDEPTNWTPNPNGAVRCLTLTDNSVFVGGDFSNIGGEVRQRIAEVDPLTGQAVGFNFRLSHSPSSISVHNDIVYAAGAFTNAGNAAPQLQRRGLASFSRLNGELTDWYPLFDTRADQVAVAGGRIVVGGYFHSAGGVLRARFAALDGVSGAVLPLNVTVGGIVNAIALSSNAVYIGGSLSNILTQPRHNIGAIHRTTGELLDWSPNLDDDVISMAVDNEYLYVGGAFLNVAGEQRNRLARFSLASGNVSSWNPNVNGLVRSIEPFENQIYIGGDFTTVGSLQRNRVAAVTRFDGVPSSWNPDVNDIVFSVHRSDEGIYISGDFTEVGGLFRPRIARIHPSTGIASNWNPLANSRVKDVLVANDRVYAFGSFTEIGQQPRTRMAELDISTGLATPWSTSISPGVNFAEPTSEGLILSAGLTANPNFFTPFLTRYKWCFLPDLPSFAADTVPGCLGQSVELSINSGNLNDATEWHWYANECGVDYLGSGSSILVSPTETTTYYVRGQGGCAYGGDCAAITVTVPEASIDEHVACGSFEWIDGNTYTQSTTAPSFLLEGATQNGCDSLVVLHLTIVGAFDDCGDCYAEGESDPSWNTSCLDCTGVVNGDAFIDPCGECVGGSTGLEACDPCIADFSSDGYVSILDLSALLQDWGCISDCTADVTGDGVVNIDDLLLMLQLFGQYCN